MPHGRTPFVPLHGLQPPASGDLSVALLLVLGVAGLVTVALAGIGVAAVLRRRTRPYLFIAVALLTLSARTGVAVLMMAGLMREPNHLLLEHCLDVAMAGLVLGAVYYARDADVRNADASAKPSTPDLPSHDGERPSDSLDDP